MMRDPEAWVRLGVKIRERRESLGVSRRQLSERAGVSEKAIQTAEEGRVPRARWPQSLRLMESAIRWEAGSMQRILEGGEPKEIHGLPSLFESDSRQQAPAQSETEYLRELDTRLHALTRLPAFFRNSLGDVVLFGIRAASLGADERLVLNYDQALDALLFDVTSRPQGEYGLERTHHPRSLLQWMEAVSMDRGPEKEKEEQSKSMDAKTRTLGEEGSDNLAKEVRRLSEEVCRLAKKLDGISPSAGDA
jgi:transcriptional regulator with XRE-family HTH domain